ADRAARGLEGGDEVAGDALAALGRLAGRRNTEGDRGLGHGDAGTQDALAVGDGRRLDLARALLLGALGAAGGGLLGEGGAVAAERVEVLGAVAARLEDGEVGRGDREQPINLGDDGLGWKALADGDDVFAGDGDRHADLLLQVREALIAAGARHAVNDPRMRT